MNHVVARQIGIDAGHRIMTHGSKCRHLHGHRYTIEAVCEAEGALHSSGEQTDMVLDFGFLKEEMVRLIDEPCDHGLILSIQDSEVLRKFAPHDDDASIDAWLATVRDTVQRLGAAAIQDSWLGQKLYIVACHPTAERMAEHWFRVLEPAVAERSAGSARLTAVVVHETPNCWSQFRP